MQDFDNFTRPIRLQYMYHGENNKPHPFHVKSNWNPPVQPSVTLESYLEETKLQLTEIETAKLKNNFHYNEIKAIKELKNNPQVNIKKADKGTTTVIMNKQDKIGEGQIQLNNEENYRPLATPMVEQTYTRVEQLIRELHQSRHIDTMTKKWLSQTANPPRIPEFYTLTKIHKVHPVGRPIISGCKRPNRTYIIICRQSARAHSQTTTLVSQRYERLYQLHREYDSPRKHHSGVYGCNQPVHKHTAGGRHYYRVQCI